MTIKDDHPLLRAVPIKSYHYLRSFSLYLIVSAVYHMVHVVAADVTRCRVETAVLLMQLKPVSLAFRSTGHVLDGLHLTLRVVVGVSQGPTAGLRDERALRVVRVVKPHAVVIVLWSDRAAAVQLCH